jgi:hypothetical protein
MNLDTANIIGLCGSTVFILAFIYANVAKEMDKLLFNALNLIGAALLLYSLWVHPNLPAAFLEISWACIALVGLVNAIRAKRKART